MIPLKCDVICCFKTPDNMYKINKIDKYRCRNHIISCNIKKCNNTPIISLEYNRKKLYYCKYHGKQYNITLCDNRSCNMIATYGNNKPTYCIKHRQNNMEILVDQCSFFGCYNKPTHNYMLCFKELNIPKGIYCHLHANDKMINIKEYNDGICIKTFDLESQKDTENINVTTQTEIIMAELPSIIEHKSIDNDNNNLVNNDKLINNIDIIYDMRKYEKKDIINEYEVVENWDNILCDISYELI